MESSYIKGYGLLLFAVLVWSTIEASSQHLQKDVAYVNVAMFRFIIGGGVLIPWGIYVWIKKGNVMPTGLDVLKLVGISLLGITSTFFLYHTALELVYSSSVAILISMTPVSVAAVVALGKRQLPHITLVIGLLLGAVGILCLVVVNGGFGRGWINATSFAGVGLVLLASITLGLYMYLLQPFSKKYGTAPATSFTLLMGGLGFLPLVLFEGVLLQPREFTPTSWGILLYLGIVTVAMGYFALFIALSLVATDKGVSMMYIKPAAATVFALVIGVEPLSPFTIGAVILVTGSLCVIILGPGLLAKAKDNVS